MNPPGSGSRSPPSFPPSPQRREQRAIRIGIALSALLHLVALAFYPVLTGHPEGLLPTRESELQDPLQEGIELVELLEVLDQQPAVAVAEVVAPPVEEPEDPPQEPVAIVVATGDEPPGEEAATDQEDATDEDELTVAERLQPRMVDPRVWAPLPAGFGELSEFERAELLLRGMIQSWNDSMAVAEALSERARDWTFTDAEGRRWGLAPGRLYLGDFSIPLPVQLQLSPGAGDPWIRDDLVRGAASAVIQETWTERARTIRERMELERGEPPGGAADNDGG